MRQRRIDWTQNCVIVTGNLTNIIDGGAMALRGSQTSAGCRGVSTVAGSPGLHRPDARRRGMPALTTYPIQQHCSMRSTGPTVRTVVDQATPRFSVGKRLAKGPASTRAKPFSSSRTVHD